MKAAKANSQGERLFYLAASGLFLFLLIYSTPHLVHHSLDQPLSGPCPVFSAAKGCQVQPGSIIDFSIAQITSEWVTPSFEVWIPYLSPSPFSKRAPPAF